MEFSSYENIEIFIKTQSFTEIIKRCSYREFPVIMIKNWMNTVRIAEKQLPDYNI